MARSATIKKQQNKDKITPVKVFEGIIMTLIIVSSIMLVVDNPFKDPESNQIIFLGYVDNCFTILFTLEALVKIIAMGFFMRAHSYLRDSWNIMDFSVVVLGWISSIINSENISAIKVIRILRPLRTIN